MVALSLIGFRIKHFFYQDLNYFLSSSCMHALTIEEFLKLIEEI